MPETFQGKNDSKYIIDTELSQGNLKFLPEFLKRNYLLQQNKYRNFRNILINKGTDSLNYRVVIPETQQ